MNSSNSIVNISDRLQSRARVASRTIVDRVVIPASEGMYVIPFREIRHCGADSNYCRICLVTGEELIASKTLKHIMSLLPESMFIRVHQSHLVNRQSVRFIGQDHIKLDDGTSIPVARSRRGEVQDAFR